MIPIRQNSKMGWNRYVEDRDQRIHLGYLKQEEPESMTEKQNKKQPPLHFFKMGGFYSSLLYSITFRISSILKWQVVFQGFQRLISFHKRWPSRLLQRY